MTQIDLTRRSFLKACGLVGATAAVGASLSGCLSSTDSSDSATSGGEQVGEYTVMRTSCHGCIQMCPALAYLKDGVVVKLEGDPEAPESRGSLCIKGLNQLNTMYSPRRILHPLRRAGERGENKWEVISWDDAVEEAAMQIMSAIEQYGPYSFFCSVGGGGSYSFLEAMTLPLAFMSPTVFEPGCAQCYLPRTATAGYMYGGSCQSVADNDVQEIFRLGEDNKAEVVVIWGAQPSVSQTAQSGRAMAELRASGVKTVVVDPNFSPDATKADVWLPIRPGTDTKLLLCWFRYLFENELYNVSFTKYWTNLPFLIDLDPASERYKLPVLAKDLFPDFEQSTPENTPAYVCYDAKTESVVPFEYSAPEDATVDPVVIWEGEYEGKAYKTAGQIYWDEAEPWTLQATAEACWLTAESIEAAIRLYAHADDGGCEEHVAGIVHGVATDQMESSSQVPLGCMGLDFIMGYVNKPGVTMTQRANQYVDYSKRPLFYFDGFAGQLIDMLGVGAVVGMTEEENEARMNEIIAAGAPHDELTQVMMDRLGMVEHKGLFSWFHSHIPTVREAIATGEPYKPRVWFDMSGNKLAMLGNAQSWYEVFPEIDYIIGQYPMLTSFHVEAADLVFPLREWLEEPMCENPQLNYYFLQNECTHIGETVSHSIPAARVLAKCVELAGGEEAGYPIAMMYQGQPDEASIKETVAATLGAESWADLQAHTNDYVPMVVPDEEWFQYYQHENIADDDLPAGFATESRKIEVYCQLLIKMARTGYPFIYPEKMEACADYSPICCAIEPAESPYEGAAGYDPEYPLVLTSGRVPYFHHGTMRHAAYSRELHPTAEIRINPATAAEYGIEHMDWVKVTSRRGSTHARAWLTEGVNPRTVWMERFWNPECYDETQEKQTAGWRECNVNILTKNDAPFNEVFGSYTNRGFTVKIEKSEKPDGIWVEAEEFAPFLPTLQDEPRTEDVF